MRFYIGCFLFCLCSTVIAQPSGGPYGPIWQTYELPKAVGKIYYVASDGQAEQTGESLTKPTTLEAAIERVRTGDAIILRNGTYRTGNLVLNQGITIQPYKDEQPVLKGTYVATDWKQQENGLWVTKWQRLFPNKPQSWWRRYRHGSVTPQWRFNNDMVFVDGKFLQAVGWEGEIDQNSYYIDYDAGLVYIATDPTDRLVEITAFNIAILRTTKDVHGKKSDRKGYTIRGITFTQYAYRALEIEGTDPEGLSDEANHGKEVVGTTLEHCTISFCSRVAGYFRGDHMTIRHCRVSDTSTEGIYILSSNDVLLEKNIIMRNNIEDIAGYYPAAVKIFNQCYRVTCRDNLVIDQPNSIGIWYDVGNVDGVFVNNWIENVHFDEKIRPADDVYPSGSGFYFEISKRAICAGNVFVNCDYGIHLRNSSDVQMYNNTLVNSTVLIGRTARTAAGDHFDWHPSTGPGLNERDGHLFMNNLLTGDANFSDPLLSIWQKASLCETHKTSQLQQLDNNVYVRVSDKTSDPLIQWRPASNDNCQTGFKSLESLRKTYPQFSANSRNFLSYNGPLFKSMKLGNYQLSATFPGSESGTQLSAQISKLLGKSEKDATYIGAYPPIRFP